MRCIVVQMGARRGYAVPLILARYGFLEKLYTEICGNVGIGRVANLIGGISGSGRIARLATRHVPELIRSKTVCFWAPVVKHALRSAISGSNLETQYRESLRFADELGTAMIGAGCGKATHLYSMLGEGGPFLAEARRRGLQIICEVYIALSADRIVAEESRKFPSWEDGIPDYEAVRGEKGGESFLDIADWLICPSEAVRDDLIECWGISPTRTAVVPYGVDPAWLELDTAPVPGRVLFVGTANLRKGIHYLAMAAGELSRRGRSYDFRVLGDASRTVREQMACRTLTFVGRIPRDQIPGEFQLADVLVLPSIAEGSAEVTYEALAAGVPVITTRAAGSIVTHGVEGVIVAERDPLALADAIEQIVEHRQIREKMSTSARKRAAEYTWERYGTRLIEALLSFGSTGRCLAQGLRAENLLKHPRVPTVA